MPAALNYYHVLDTSSSASFRELKKQYFQRAKECHPDLHDGSAAKEEQFKLLVLAFEVLSDPHKRQQYDATLQASKGAPIDLEHNWQPTDHNSIMDTHADDILEELIVGNNVPLFATFQTLMRDLDSERQMIDEVSRSLSRLLNNRPARDGNKSTAGNRTDSRRLLGSKRKHK